MWYLFKVMSFILILGTTHGVFRKQRSVNPEASMNISQIISYWGYPDEEYDITTEDGYILGLYRIPYGKTNSENNSVQRLVVYLQHGLLTSASSWISNLPNNSLGFLLADAGYDVWMGNSRGTTWSRKHLYLKTNSKEFWAFSFDEMAKYDLPASIDFIVKQTQQQQIFYVGHSQGTTIAFITFSTIPKIAERIKVFFALAPVFSIKYSKSPLIKMAYNWKSLIKFFSGSKEFLPNTSFKRFVGSKLCPLKIFGKICRDVLFMISGYDLKNLNTSRVDVYMSQNPAGTSVQNMVHWSQLFNSSHLKAFDWGSPDLNLVHFNQTTSPLYNVTSMNVPTATWSGDSDLLADPEDVKILLPEITNHIYHKTISYYNHVDFLFGLDVYHQVYSEIIDIIQGNP
ncbi:PREDICTED: lipase member J [Bison bison bison]|uniref:Lipase n=1 Tax=Bison bison bison TaxID=43346 RepID=A0A6P3GZK0_BISBB|nr:PREDICTED: lipase member J [Bison bison bison]XP_061258701.1 lipase member J-like isoform X1 [Bos javanicus]XP_061258702.1 lipase member J-like isoform X1 [Bos javanicus]XP_061258703.1 lipase member J-like isoform X1 [Bos javanicus]XP_061258704.1 lipase member J-like isoform X1 [Bos javanicus]XP_061258705.1 lipase member J-like isoform X1 [Bos javanicus]